ncbi:hypothetical protein L1887_22430 [Cichorium endivia]|nr:hypothetical protein L1887_22430 [Cichorium endivia]
MMFKRGDELTYTCTYVDVNMVGESNLYLHDNMIGDHDVEVDPVEVITTVGNVEVVPETQPLMNASNDRRHIHILFQEREKISNNYNNLFLIIDFGFCNICSILLSFLA